VAYFLMVGRPTSRWWGGVLPDGGAAYFLMVPLARLLVLPQRPTVGSPLWQPLPHG